LQTREDELTKKVSALLPCVNHPAFAIFFGKSILDNRISCVGQNVFQFVIAHQSFLADGGNGRYGLQDTSLYHDCELRIVSNPTKPER
jgi:hypothetical protein